MAKSKLDSNTIKAEYDLTAPKLEALSMELSRQISILISGHNIHLAVPLQYRPKLWSSVSEKISQGRFTVKKSILEMQDLVGIRIILLFKRDVKTVADLIRPNFKIISEYNTEDKLQDDQFGYSSTHLVIELSEEWLKVPSLKDFASIKCEIQIRTIAQHSWAEASNIFQYKIQENVPKPLKRTIGRISALLETVDLEFERILEERISYVEDIRDIEYSVSSDQELDIEVLRKILDEKLPPENKLYDEDYADLLKDLRQFNIKQVGGLLQIIDKHYAETKLFDNKIAKAITHNYNKNGSLDSGLGYETNESQIEKVKKGFFFSYTGLLRHMIELHVGSKKWMEYTISTKHFDPPTNRS